MSEEQLCTSMREKKNMLNNTEMGGHSFNFILIMSGEVSIIRNLWSLLDGCLHGVY